MKKHLAAAAAAILLALPAYAADSVKIGFVTTLSGPAGIIGKHMKDASDLALAMLGGKIGGLPAEILYGDDQFKPDVGRQGADMMAGFKRYFKGKVAAEVYTKFGQSDYQVELSQIREANPKAVFVFLPGGMGIQFVKQYAQSGLREKIPLYSAFTVDETTLPAI